MMNILTDVLPEEIKINGKAYPIETDFRTWIKFSQLAFSGKADAVSFAEMIALVVKELPTDINATIAALLEFYSCHNTQKSDTNKSKQNRMFDFDSDAAYIYAAFMQQYGIDLTRANLHWWTFKSLFDSISEETHFGKIMQYRCTDISQIKDKEMKKFYQKMKCVYALPDNRSDEEKERDFAEGLSGLF